MAKFVLKDYSVTINAVDLSDHVESVSVNYEAEIVEKTSMGEGSKTRLPGLLDGSFDVTFRQDYAASSVDATLFPLIGAAAFAIELRPTSAVVSATNPKFTGNALLATYNPMGGSIGELAAASASFMMDGVLARGIS